MRTKNTASHQSTTRSKTLNKSPLNNKKKKGETSKEESKTHTKRRKPKEINGSSRPEGMPTAPDAQGTPFIDSPTSPSIPKTRGPAFLRRQSLPPGSSVDTLRISFFYVASVYLYNSIMQRRRVSTFMTLDLLP